MDHLPLSSDPIPAFIVKVPHIGLAQYDKGGFDGFLDRIDLPEEDVVDFQRDDGLKDWRLSCLQEWLFFGSLHEFSKSWNVPLDLESFIESDNMGTAYITTRPLIGFAKSVVHANANAYAPSNWSSLAPLEPWKNVMAHRPLFEIACLTQRLGMPQEVQRENQRKMSGVVQKVNNLRPWQPNSKTTMTSSQWRIVWSISVLLESLANISLVCFGSQRLTSPRLDFDIIPAGMRREGWCPSRFSQLTHLSPSLLYCLRLLPSFDHRGHTGCTTIRCLDVPLTTIRPNPGHDEKTCGGSCAMAGVKESEIVAILIGNDYPVIKICFDEHGTPHLGAVAARNNPGYVAISHVW